MSKLRKELIELYQRTIDYDDPDRQYIGFLADRSIEIVTKHLITNKLPMTQQELANYCGVSRQTVNSWIKHPEKITVKHLSKLLKLEESTDIIK